ncbi:lytic murein transglycosylase [Verminephrobacter aporrectodeae subsp. tuberculatae]|uniref:Lytic murein transglycosylase n=1 Tax=Verminephrobacter aporrectodeae subsp. tuberculatae TaxID=1110392 RepID=A0ABT3KTJ0_9BURK|nr:hypothetical protein [Verminephrobacter aporrectodeae]MCW5222403.1 lytic murein transglycosylase [Verminephrobacter aporrectodeae subsp. tuberculatae]MCW5257389.1 lytic murein transglycosylase [Verminephrobacter aporrectodeae subsp. tuberculatae]MCW5287867.1 lytic murein transglycosylase [Verminephrobacter aporrectodeae subsp. tuberculatae]MCW5321427.1 lytic murein transglycosylase [Verminephrobacter aporrectodeae subsp. tuberculatae]MCW8164614.1 lytic murein transglycosylase [Verminephroba
MSKNRKHTQPQDKRPSPIATGSQGGPNAPESGRQAPMHPHRLPTAGRKHRGPALLSGLLLLSLANQNTASELPPGAKKHLPTLAAEQAAHWPQAPLRSALAAQIEQETCPSLKSAKCWNPRTELKTAREYGFGLGQLTITAKFDNFAQARKLHTSLRDWKFENRFDAQRQLRTMILMDRAAYNRLTAIDAQQERLAMTLAAYNGGLAGVQQDRRLCAQTTHCDPKRWFGHVERHSLKAKTRTAGYGKSFFEINREYVRAILHERRKRYSAYFGEA